MAINPKKHEMPTQKPQVRAHNFDEVALGYTEEIAIAEAQRCITCKNQPCVSGCPVNIDIPNFISKIKDGKFVDKKKSGIKTLEESIANLKDKTSNETLKSVVNKSRKNVYENAKFFNEQNRCLTIQGKEPHEITSLMPYNLSDEIGLKKIIGKDKIDNKKGKAYVNFSGKASDIAYKSLEFANVMLGATFIFPLTILAAPLCVGGFVAAAGTVAYEMVRKNIKQYRINHLTPQKIKNETNKEIENTIKSEITKAKKEMKEALKTARQNISDLTELKEAEKNKF